MDKQFCPNCEKSGPVEVIRKDETIKVRDMDIRTTSTVSKCSVCHETFATETQEEENLRKAYDEYRRQKKLLTPSEIKQLREQYGLSQTNFSRWLGWGDITVHRYESGALQDSVHNETLILLHDPKNAQMLLDSTKGNLDDATRQRLEKKISDLLSEDLNQRIESDLETALSAEDPSELNGYRRFDIERFENLVLYIIKKVGPSFKTALNKFLWYIDFGFYQEQTKSITGAKYVKFPHGPVPKGYDYIFANMVEKGQLEAEEVSFVNHDTGEEFTGEKYRNLVAPNTDLFQGNELKTADQWISLLKGKSATELGNLAHEEKGYKDTNDKEPISYKYASELKLHIGADK